jgi:hypothetical protein
MVVLGGMFVLGGITTADVPATQAQAKVHPPVARPQTLFATSSMRFDVPDLIEMGTLSHDFLLWTLAAAASLENKSRLVWNQT